MSVSSAAVTVTTSATALHAADADPHSVAVANVGASTVYLGGSDVTTANGFPLAAGASVPVGLSPSEILYGRVTSGTVEVRVLRQGVG